MNLIIPVSEIDKDDQGLVGGKACALALMTRNGMNVPGAISVTTEAYDTYVKETGLRTKIMMELNRKAMEDMRWEEMWDLSLRVRTSFRNTPLPSDLYPFIRKAVERDFADSSVVVRSSAPGEDTSGTSFAGLHSSYVNIRGTEAILEHIKLVWASLWSDASIMYRRELGLDERKSSMAVVIQEMITGDVSGIGFGQNPNDPSQCVIEAVYGLNQGLVDGTLEPDRWIIERKTGRHISHSSAERTRALRPARQGTDLRQLPEEFQHRPPLTAEEVSRIYNLLMEAESLFGTPQDVEWTIKEGTIYVLQSRPITTLTKRDDDERGWYLSLKRSMDNLRALRKKIENELVPALEDDTRKLAAQDLTRLSDSELSEELDRRKATFGKWKKIYWDDFIPFAHGMRMFGIVYNDTVQPEDPYEFISLLSTGRIESMDRNNLLEEMASHIRSSSKLVNNLRRGDRSDQKFNIMLNRFIESFGNLICKTPLCEEESEYIINLVLEMATGTGSTKARKNRESEKEKNFLSCFEAGKVEYAKEILDLGRASYRMRDNDNIYMGRLKGQVARAEYEIKRRSGSINVKETTSASHFDSVILSDETGVSEDTNDYDSSGYRLKARQITGQPAGPGIATGPAHVIKNASDLMNFRKGEVLVCDSIDPNMTFVVPLASAVVERRGGMLIHGAIIAREYGLPCVTGIPMAADVIRTGDRITVDGYLGIVIIDTTAHSGSR